jgi:lysophospholipase L1-like esterase
MTLGEIMNRIKVAWRWRVQEAREVGRRLREPESREEYRDGLWQCQWRRMCFMHDADLGWRFIPRLKARVFHDGRFYTVRTNAAGFRSDSEFVSRKQKRLRLLLLGDSYAAGDGVNNEERFGDLLAARLDDGEIYNLAMPGTGADQQVLTCEKAVPAWDADAILFCMADTDIFRLTLRAWPVLEWAGHRIRYRAKPYFRLAGDRLDLCNVPVPRGTRGRAELAEWGPDGFGIGRDTAAWAAAYADGSESGELLKALLRRLLDAAGAKPVLLAPLPSPHTAFATSPAPYLPVFRALHAPAQRRFFVDVLDAAGGDGAGRRSWFLPNDPHYSPAGHRAIARALEAGIRAFYPDWWRG